MTLKIEDEKVTVSKNMMKYGGSFISSLGRALMSADHINTSKIRETWNDEWVRYLNFERDDRENKNG